MKSFCVISCPVQININGENNRIGSSVKTLYLSMSTQLLVVPVG